MDARHRPGLIGLPEQFIELKRSNLALNGLAELGGRSDFQQVRTPDQIIELANPQLSHELTHFFTDGIKEGHNVFRFTPEFESKLILLGRHPNRTGVQVAHSEHGTAGSNQRSGSKVEFFSSQQGTHDDVSPCLEATIGSEHHPGAQIIEHEGLLCFSKTQLERHTRILDRALRRGPGSTVIATDENHIGKRLGNTGSNGSDSGASHEFDTHLGARIDLFEVVNELRQIFDRVNIVVRWRRNQGDTRSTVSQSGNQWSDFVSG